MKIRHLLFLVLLAFLFACNNAARENKTKELRPSIDAVNANRKLMDDYHEEVWVKKNVAYTKTVVADSFFSHSSQPGTPKGPEPVIQFLQSFYKAFPDLADTKTHLIADKNFAVLGWVVSGTMKDSLWGIPPTNKKFAVSGNDILRIENGKFTEHWFGLSQVMDNIFEQCGISFPKQK